ncbi:MAG TPA: hypothetical protein DCE41_17235 [Cytophagales bacterium]|nr:hypothetical protein [Cytophagales bacterium]
MKKIVVLGFLVLLPLTAALAQQYRVRGTISGGGSGDDPCAGPGSTCSYEREFILSVNNGSGTSKFLGRVDLNEVQNFNVVVNFRPAQLSAFTREYEYDGFDDQVYIDCEKTTTRDLGYGTCLSTSYSMSTTCSGATVSFVVEPVLGYTSQPNSALDRCLDESISFNITPFTNTASWQFSISGGSWQSFSPPNASLNSSGSFKVTDLPGYTAAYLQKPIRFKYVRGNCLGIATDEVTNSYTFLPKPPGIASVVVNNKKCLDDASGGTVTITPSRSPAAGETFRYEIRNNNTNLDPNTFVDENSNGVFSGLSNGTYWAFIRIISGVNNGNCGDLSMTQFTVNNPTTLLPDPKPGSYADQCEAAITLTGESQSGVVQYWWYRGGTQLSTSRVANTTLNVGANTFIYRYEDGFGCVKEKSVTINRSNIPTAAAGTNQTVCMSTATLSANSAGDGGGRWTLVSGAGNFTASTSPNSQVNNLGQGDNVFRWTIDDGSGDGTGGCVSSDEVTINYRVLPATNAGVDDLACLDNAVLSASGIALSGTQGTWSSSDAGISFVDPNNPNTTVNGLSVGGNVLTWTISDVSGSGCPSVNDQVTVTRTDLAIFEDLTARTDPTCVGDANGQITVFATGGNPKSPSGLDYRFILSGADSQQDSIEIGDSLTFFGLPKGLYNISVQNREDGCVQNLSSINLSDPPTLTLSETLSDYNGWNITCRDSATGTIDVTGGGGTGSLRYVWDIDVNDTASVASVSNLPAGDYTLTVIDSFGCTESETYTLDEPFALQAEVDTLIDISCFGIVDGTIDLEVADGTMPYSYLWSNGDNTRDVAGLAKGTYSVGVTDANGCFTEVTNLSIAEPFPLDISVVQKTDVACFDETTGELIMGPTGGTGAVEYSFDGVTYTPTDTLGNLVDSTYLIWGQDARGCIDLTTATIGQPSAPLVATIIEENTSLCGDFNGSAEVQATGGNGSYVYGWKSVTGDTVVGDSTALLQSVLGGDYRVTVTDARNCLATDVATIGSIESPVVTIAGIDSTACDYTRDGGAQLNVTGAGPFAYLWSNGDTRMSPDTLSPGDHNVVVTDTNACETEIALNVPAPQPLALTLDSLFHPLCFDDANGAIYLSVAGGTGAYTYDWDNTTATTQDITGLVDSTYALYLTDANNCELRDTFQLVEPELLTGLAAGTDVSCADFEDGQIDLTLSGGTLPYTYDWSHGDSVQIADSLDGGLYSVTVTDDNGCEWIENDLAVINPDSVILTVESITNVFCFGDNTGQIVLSGAGGTGALAYSVDSVNFQSDTTFANLVAGDYFLVLTDDNGCTNRIDTVVSEAPLLVANLTELEDSFCATPDGSAGVTVTGGTGSYLYDWRDVNDSARSDSSRMVNVFGGVYTVLVTDSLGCTADTVALISSRDGADITFENIDSTTCSYSIDALATISLDGGEGDYEIVWDAFQNDSLISNPLAQGSHFVTVTDSNQCVTVEPFEVLAPDTLQVTNPLVTDPSCYGFADGSIDITPEGGTGAYAFAWSSTDTTEDLSSLIIGDYSVVLSDANGCTDTTAYTLIQPDSLIATAVVRDITCAGAGDGMIDVTLSGGTEPYAFTWNTPDTTEDLSDLEQGLYTVGVLDDQGCELSIQDLEIVDPDPVVLTLDALINVDCFSNATGTISLTGVGGTGDLLYTLDGANTQTTGAYGSLRAGDYQVVVTDENACADSVDLTVTEPELLVASISETLDSFCSEPNGSSTVSVTGGTPAYLFEWRNSVNVGVGLDAQLTDVWGDTYSVTVTDSLGCISTVNTTVQSFDSPEVTVLSIDSALCSYSADGQAEIGVLGNGPYDILWDAVETDLFTNEALLGGIHTVDVIDTNRCRTITEFTIPAPEELLASIDTHVVPTCSYSFDGSVTLGVTGGTGAYGFAWGEGSQTATQTGLSTGTWPVTITDANDCVLEYDAVLTGVDTLSIAVLENTTPTCVDGEDGILEVVASGGNGGYSYTWPDRTTNPRNEALAAGTYTLQVQDNRVCIATFDLTVVDPEPFLIDLGEDQEICEGSDFTFTPISKGALITEADGATFDWTSANGFASTTSTVSVGEEGTYRLAVTNSDGCVALDSVAVIIRNDILQADFLMVSEAYVGDTVIIIDITLPAPDGLTWDFGGEVTQVDEVEEVEEVIYNEAGVYQVTLEATLGECLDRYWTEIEILERSGRPGTDEDIFGRPVTSLIQAYTIYPNPSDGEFTVGVKLSEQADVKLRLISLAANQLEWEATESGSDEYETPVSLPWLQPGLYVLSLEAEDEREALRVLIK